MLQRVFFVICMLCMLFTVMNGNDELHPVYGHQQNSFSINGYDIVDANSDDVGDGQELAIVDEEKIEVGGGGYRYQITLLNPESGKTKSFLSRVINEGDWSTVVLLRGKKNHFEYEYSHFEASDFGGGDSVYKVYYCVDYKLLLDDSSERVVTKRFYLTRRAVPRNSDIENLLRLLYDTKIAAYEAIEAPVIAGDRLKFSLVRNQAHFTDADFVVELYRDGEYIEALQSHDMRRNDTFVRKVDNNTVFITGITKKSYGELFKDMNYGGEITVFTFEKVPGVFIEMENKLDLDKYQSQQYTIEDIDLINCRFKLDDSFIEKEAYRYKMREMITGKISYFVKF